MYGQIILMTLGAFVTLFTVAAALRPTRTSNPYYI